MAPKVATKKPAKFPKSAPKAKPIEKAADKAVSKAAPKISPPPPGASLGTKRQCPKCSSKFYDFAKSEVFCPKCGHEIDLTKLTPVLPPAPPKPPPRKEVDVDVVVSTDSDFESLDDLGGDDDVTVEGITADDDADDADEN